MSTPYKKIIYAEEAREKLLAGVRAVTKAVGTTLGPKGRNIALGKRWNLPNVVHDGVSVAKEVILQDPFENLGAMLVIEASEKTNDITGDGTTTATILVEAIVEEGIKNITAGANPMILNKGIQRAAKMALDSIKKQAEPVKDDYGKITQVAVLSAQNKEIGDKVVESLKRVGQDGVITVEEGKGLEIVIRYSEGMEFDKGWISPYFITDPRSMEAVIENPYIVFTDARLTSPQDVVQFLTTIAKVSKNIVIIAQEISGGALATFVVNKMKGILSIAATETPGFGERRMDQLQDMAILTGGQVISEELGRKLDELKIEDCGRAEKVIIEKNRTVIVGGKGDKKKVQDRIEQIKAEKKKPETTEFDKEKLEERLAKLSSGVAVIEVGAATEAEMKEKQERVKDAVSATKAAVDEGIVPGGGIVLLKAAEAILTDDLKGDELTGAKILKKALEAPIRRLAFNSGIDGGEVITKVRQAKPGVGFDVLDEQYKDMVIAGIIDPVKVTRSALQNAVSAAMMILTTEGCIVEPEEENKGGDK